MNLKPMVVDLETSGLSIEGVGVWQIGAIDLNTMDEFFDEARIDDEDGIVEIADARKTFFQVTGKTEEELRHKNKQSQKELFEKFFKWAEGKKFKNFVCQNPGWDMAWLWSKMLKYKLKRVFGYRAFDLHTIAQIKFNEINNNFLINEEKGKSDMDLKNTLKFCGFPEDPRGNHNALEDAKLTAECFTRLMDGKNLFPEYSKFKVPEELRK